MAGNTCLENDMVMMEVSHSSINVNVIILINHRTVDQIAELHEGADSTYHLQRYMVCNGWKTDLVNIGH